MGVEKKAVDKREEHCEISIRKKPLVIPVTFPSLLLPHREVTISGPSFTDHGGEALGNACSWHSIHVCAVSYRRRALDPGN